MTSIIKLSSSVVTIFGCLLMLSTTTPLVTSIPVQSSSTVSSASILGTPPLPLVATTPGSSLTTAVAAANQSTFPNLFNSLLVQPLVDLNSQLAQAVNSLPERFAANGQNLGSALVQPIQLGAATSNQLASQLNDTIKSVSEAVHPVIIRPLAWMVNSTFGEMALNALNYTTSQLGSKINTVGERISSTGEGVSNAGHSMVTFVQELDQALRQLNTTETQARVNSDPTLLTTTAGASPVTFETTTTESLPELATFTEFHDDLSLLQVNTVSPLTSK